ncbi:uncharacterized protein EV420DRAFT_1481711 [Desarmillaria tabescens]|uniref:Uncharacterized protein n=1 Tax=Armillaria tabescens TaxID=1929756 RepID=A0AA39N1R3_ARMTA|nr:uncharacterized protein EV420DRAFT_1481711 [Desarmillaria tabescens]KAK0453980.1 hypothetical protein EV420DRAFT_1481711 [Desarmillaria tabescens]
MASQICSSVSAGRVMVLWMGVFSGPVAVVDMPATGASSPVKTQLVAGWMGGSHSGGPKTEPSVAFFIAASAEVSSLTVNPPDSGIVLIALVLCVEAVKDVLEVDSFEVWNGQIWNRELVAVQQVAYKLLNDKDGNSGAKELVTASSNTARIANSRTV